MKTVVTGGTGVIGRAAVRALVDAGHDVVVVTRSAVGAQTVARMGAESVRGNVLDVDSLKVAYDGAEAVINLTTQRSRRARRAAARCLAATRPAADHWRDERGGGGSPRRRTTCGAGERQLPLRRPGR